MPRRPGPWGELPHPVPLLRLPAGPRRMRQALVEYRDRGRDGDAPPDADVDALRQRVAELECENAELRELADERARQLEELTGRLAALEDGQQSGDDAGVVEVENGVDADGASGREGGAGLGPDWQPPRRRPGMPDAGVVTLEEQPDEIFAFGPAAPLVAEWRQLRAQGGLSISRADRAQAAVRRWELEALMLGQYHLTLPPETYPLDDARRREHVRWRQEAMAEARTELRRAKRSRLLLRVITLGLWRK